MVASQDIDALLIGALYGELTPADEARLAAHLDSHPTDRSALDDLRGAREAVRESRIFATQLEPPQAISALLLQEAARRAPRKVAAAAADEHVGWFQRFTRSFMAHPAMAAAAMLVVVIGVAGTLYMKNGSDAQFAEERVAAPTATVQLEQEKDHVAAATRKEAPADELDNHAGTRGKGDSFGSGAIGAGAAAGSGSAYDVDLADSKQQAAQRPHDDDVKQGQQSTKSTEVQRAQHVASTPAVPKTPAAHDGIVVHSPTPMAPEEIPQPPPKLALADPNTAAAPPEKSAPGGAGGAPANANGPVGYAPPPPQAQPGPSPTTTAPARERTADKPAPDKNESKAEAAADTSLVAWAKEQHNRVQAFVKAGKCDDAAKIALDISTRAPEYYAQYFATDRSIKACSSYFQAARDKEAEKSQKARAQKRVNANEPAPAQNDMK